MNDAFAKLKADNIINVFQCALKEVRTTRTEISRITGLSYVTVDKVCNALIELDILSQSFTKDSSAQRRSRILSVKLRNWIGVYVFEPDAFTFNIFDLSLRCIYSHKHIPSYEADVFLDDHIKRFLDASLRSIKGRVNGSCCCGVGILVPGNYDESKDSVTDASVPHFNSIKIREAFREYTFGCEPLILSVYSAYAKYVSSESQIDEHTLCLFLDKARLGCAYVIGKNDCSVRIKDIGILSPLDRTDLKSLSKRPPDPDIFFAKLSDIIFTIMNTAGIDKVTVSGSLYSEKEIVALVLSECLSRICQDHFMIPPPVVCADIRTDGGRFISREIRTRWFLSKIVGEDSP